MCLQYKSFENTVGKGEIARNENFLPFSLNLELKSANYFGLEESKICWLGKLWMYTIALEMIKHLLPFSAWDREVLTQGW